MSPPDSLDPGLPAVLSINRILPASERLTARIPTEFLAVEKMMAQLISDEAYPGKSEGLRITLSVERWSEDAECVTWIVAQNEREAERFAARLSLGAANWSFLHHALQLDGEKFVRFALVQPNCFLRADYEAINAMLIQRVANKTARERFAAR